jgi:hypothetical protein
MQVIASGAAVKMGLSQRSNPQINLEDPYASKVCASIRKR